MLASSMSDPTNESNIRQGCGDYEANSQTLETTPPGPCGSGRQIDLTLKIESSVPILRPGRQALRRPACGYPQPHAEGKADPGQGHRPGLCAPKTYPRHVTWAYSWMRPPRRSPCAPAGWSPTPHLSSSAGGPARHGRAAHRGHDRSISGLPVTTSGWCCGYVQADPLAVARDLVCDIRLFARRNPAACPVVAVTDPGDPRPRL